MQVKKPKFNTARLTEIPQLIIRRLMKNGQAQQSESDQIHPAQSACHSNNHDNNSDRRSELEIRNAVLIGDCAEWSERSLSIESNLDRSREQLALAELRLQSMGESIPLADAKILSPLQESYRNFEMAVAMHESKLATVALRLAALQEQRACITAEILAISTATSPELSDQPASDEQAPEYVNADTGATDTVDSDPEQLADHAQLADHEQWLDHEPEYRRAA